MSQSRKDEYLVLKRSIEGNKPKKAEDVEADLACISARPACFNSEITHELSDISCMNIEIDQSTSPILIGQDTNPVQLVESLPSVESLPIANTTQSSGF